MQGGGQLKGPIIHYVQGGDGCGGGIIFQQAPFWDVAKRTIRNKFKFNPEGEKDKIPGDKTQRKLFLSQFDWKACHSFTLLGFCVLTKKNHERNR